MSVYISVIEKTFNHYLVFVICCCFGEDIMFINLSLFYVAMHYCTKSVYLVN
jgi:hypothetical protein